ncbi:MAG: glycoside hydrolase family 2 TIM barrel-domain containing protein [Acidobacteriota bacterium]
MGVAFAVHSIADGGRRHATAPDGASPPSAPRTLTLPLSGTGPHDAVPWDFRCDRGRGCGTWTRIDVPSVWEQQGFGVLDYGHGERKHRVVGRYRRELEIPAAWHGRTLELEFDGVLTDATVFIDGRQIGKTHRGGFTRFRIDITDAVTPGRAAQLEVVVSNRSSSARVEAAERSADYWLFGGIFRPVRLRSLPLEAIDQLALDAQHNGTVEAWVRPRGLKAPATLRLSILDRTTGMPIEQPIEQVLPHGDDRRVELNGHVGAVTPWSAERPTLYRARVELLRGDRLLHRVERTIGFRTIEVRDAPGRDGGFSESGLFINGVRTVLRGVNRQAFHPDTGRTLSPAFNREDVRTIRSLSLNAVRTAHAPPDVAFLDACDELGLYVVNELPGWNRPAYSTAVGSQLVREMVERDQHHPSIIFWANGNENGWNPRLDAQFLRLDPQQRPILHPDVVFGGFDTRHYPTWAELKQRQRHGERGPLLLFTEMLHGLYDGGGGAGLARLWPLISGPPRGVGGFLWNLSDEAVRRAGADGEAPTLDTFGNRAADGILGPDREPSPSVDAIREVMGPLAFEIRDAATGLKVIATPRDPTLDTAELRLAWRGLRLPAAGGSARPEALRSLGAPTQESARPHWLLPAAAASADAVEIRVDQTDGGVPGRQRRLRELTHATVDRSAWWARSTASEGRDVPAVAIRQDEASLTLDASDAARSLRFDAASGEVALHHPGGAIRLGAPRPADRARIAADLTPPIAHSLDDGSAIARQDGGGPLASVVWTLDGSGWLRVDWRLDAARVGAPVGIVLPWLEGPPTALRWLGVGPWRVWGNRRHGRLGVWQVDAAESTAPRWGHGLKLDGFFDAWWLETEIDGGSLVVVLPPQMPALTAGVLAPRFPTDAGRARAASPSVDGLTLLHRLPAIGTKLRHPEGIGEPAHPGSRRGPHGVVPDPRSGTIWLWAGNGADRTPLPPDSTG